MRMFLLVVVTMLTLSGCELTRVEGKIDDVSIKASRDGRYEHDTNGGSFCPPGQAKKGNCYH